MKSVRYLDFTIFFSSVTSDAYYDQDQASLGMLNNGVPKTKETKKNHAYLRVLMTWKRHLRQ